MRMKTTEADAYALAMNAGRDAGNRSMRDGKRTAWALKDWRVACYTQRLVMRALRRGIQQSTRD